MTEHFYGDEERFRRTMDPETYARIVDDGDLCRLWARSAREYADGTAVVYDGRSLTYAGLDREIALQRGALAEAGCRPGERIALLCENSIDFVRAFFAVVTLGGVAAVLPPQLGAEEIADCCRSMELTRLLCQPRLMEKAKAADVPVLSTDCRAEAEVPAALPKPDDPCVIVLTGGTTGRRKGALLSHTAVVRGIMNACLCSEKAFRQRYLLLLPLTHIFGLVRNMLTCVYTGSTLFISKSPKDMIQDLAAFQPTLVVLVPALAELALKLRKALGRDVFGPSLKTVVTGAAPTPPYLVEEYHRLGIRLLPGYGLTEAAGLVSGNDYPLDKPWSVGLPFPEQELKLVDGELWLRGRNLFTRYVGTDESAFTEDGWFRTGDLARVDEDGFLYLVGRTKEVIKLSGGESVYPAELESRFNALPFIRDSEVFEAVADNGAHILALEVVLRETETARLGPDPAAAAMEALWEVNRAQRPAERVSRIAVRETDFERTPSMKIVRRKL